MRCEPYCHCELQFQFGDYHLGRSCRKRISDIDVTNSSNNINIESGGIGDDEQCHLPPDTKIVKVFDTSGRILNAVQNVTSTKLHGLNFMIKSKAEDVKDNMCTSSFLNNGGDFFGKNDDFRK